MLLHVLWKISFFQKFGNFLSRIRFYYTPFQHRREKKRGRIPSHKNSPEEFDFDSCTVSRKIERSNLIARFSSVENRWNPDFVDRSVVGLAGFETDRRMASRQGGRTIGYQTESLLVFTLTVLNRPSQTISSVCFLVLLQGSQPYGLAVKVFSSCGYLRVHRSPLTSLWQCGNSWCLHQDWHCSSHTCTLPCWHKVNIKFFVKLCC